jgi:hypothetical protein
MFGWLIRNPNRAAILVGILVAVVFGWVSFPREKTIEKTVADFLPENIASSPAVQQELAAVIAAVRSGEEALVAKVSLDDFKALGLAQTYVETAIGSGRDGFVITYAGRDAEGRVYVAERKVPAAGSIDPSRWLYKAVEAEIDQFGNVLRLTFERDLSALFGLLLMDLIVGAFYGIVVGMILSVLGMEGLDKSHKPKPIPAPTPMIPLDPRGIFRA